MTAFRLRFPVHEIPRWAGRYPVEDDQEVEKIAPAARERGYLTRPEFLELCAWKTPRSRPLCRRNRSALIESITREAFSTADERRRLEALTFLRGVGLPTASVILHLCGRDRYPILDARALWSLGHRKPPGKTFAFWSAYTDFARRLADAAGVEMRTLDRALWQYSKERQRDG
jgi:hypothetical protein